MPIIEINLVEGRENEKIEQCIRNIATTVHETIDTPLSSIRIYVNEILKNYFAVGTN